MPQLDLAPLMATKFHSPRPRQGGVPRTGLTEKLDPKAGHKLTLISAPAGYGKTSLVAEWVATFAGSNRRVAWVSLDEGDNDPVRFWLYLITALDRQHPGVGTDALNLLRSQPLPTEVVLAILINGLADLPFDFIWVLDDFHLITEPTIYAGLTFLLDHLPLQVHIVILTRSEPSLPLARLRMRGQMRDLRAEDLRFSFEESAQLLRDIVGFHVPEAEVAALVDRTEGWVAGLQLAAYSLTARPRSTKLPAEFSGSNRYVIDFLLEEVLRLQPPSTQRFLLETSVLDRLTSPLCDAVRETTGSQAVLEYLDRLNLFLVPMDDQRCWYRYHHLFVEALRTRLTEDQAMGLHLRAAAWFEKHGLGPEAVEHALAGKDFDLAARLVAQHTEQLQISGQVATWQRWMEAIPAVALRRRPDLCLMWALMLSGSGRLEEAKRWVQVASDSLPTAPDGGVLQGQINVVLSNSARISGDMQAAVGHAEEGLRLLPPTKGIWRGTALMILGTAYSATAPALADRFLGDVVAEAHADGNRVVEVKAACLRADVQVRLGHLRQAAATYRTALAGSEAGGTHLPAAGHAHLGLGSLYYEWNDLDEAAVHLDQALRISEGARNLDGVLYCSLQLAMLRSAQGEMDGALELLAQVEHDAGQVPLVSTLVRSTRARLNTILGNLPAVRLWAEEYEGSNRPLHPSEVLSLARAVIVVGRPQTAIQRLEPLLEGAVKSKENDLIIRGLILKALALQALGDHLRGAAILSQALDQGEPEGYIRSFVDEGLALQALLGTVKRPGLYVQKLLNSFSGPPAAAAPRPQLAEPLSERELEVLRLIATGASNQEIASRLFLAVGTVKKHINNLFGKLGATSRTHLIVKARESGLL